jgi:hypothetical protein
MFSRRQFLSAASTLGCSALAAPLLGATDAPAADSLDEVLRTAPRAP